MIGKLPEDLKRNMDVWEDIGNASIECNCWFWYLFCILRIESLARQIPINDKWVAPDKIHCEICGSGTAVCQRYVGIRIARFCYECEKKIPRPE